MSDFKEGPRQKMSREQWRVFRETYLEPGCRVCGDSLALEIHHLVSRAQLGDDVKANLITVCRLHHLKIEAHEPETCSTLRSKLTDDEVSYCRLKKGDDWLDRRYPQYAYTDERFLADFEPTPVVLGRMTPAGQTCGGCGRRVPHTKKETTPTNRPYSFRIPEESREPFKEVLTAAAQHSGAYAGAWWQWNTINAGLVLLLQGEAGILSVVDFSGKED